MAGSSATLTYDDGVDGSGLRAGVRQIVMAWTSDASDGHATGTTRKIVGELVKAVTVPGSAAPTDGYSITITDEQGVDVLAACKTGLGNRSTSSTQEVYFQLLDADNTPLSLDQRPTVCNVLTISVTNAGNAKTGTIVLYYRPQE